MDRDLHCLSTRNALIEKHPSHTVTYGRWSRIFGAWIGNPNTITKTTDRLPMWPLVGKYGRTEYQNKAIPNHLFAAYIEEIPYKFRQLVAPLGRWQWVALEAIWAIPEFAGFLESEMKGRRNSFLEICYTLRNVHSLDRDERKQFNQTVMLQKRRKTLCDLTSGGHGDQMVRNLSKIDATNLSKAQLKAFISILSDKKIADQISHLNKIPETLVRTFAHIEPWQLDPKTLCLIARMYQNNGPSFIFEHQLNILYSGLMGEHDHKTIADIKECFALSKDIPELMLILESWGNFCENGFSYPPPPTLANKQLVPVTSQKAAIEECINENGLRRSLISHNNDVYDLCAYYYKWCGDEPATVVLGMSNECMSWDVEAIGHSEFSLLEVIGKFGSTVKQTTLDEIKRTILKFIHRPK